MQIGFHYFAQVRQAAGEETEQVQLGEDATLGSAIESIADRHGPDFRALLVTESGEVRPSLLLLRNNQAADRQTPLADGDTVSILSAVAGG